MIRIDDDMKRALTFATAPRRVVSLVPSDTFNVVALGRGSSIVGRTDYCDLPDVPSVGGTKNPRVGDIVALEPDLVIANQEENTKKDLEELVQKGIRVFVSFPKRAADGLAHLARLARIFRVEADPSVRDLLRRGYRAVSEAEEARSRARPLRTFCPIWMKPLMTINGRTFMSDVLDLAGAQNVFADRERRYPLAADIGVANPIPVEARDTRYPRVTLEEVIARSPELVLLPDEPHPFSEGDADVFRAKGFRVVHTAGKDICWYGAQTVEGLPRLRDLIRGAVAGR